MGVIGQLSVNLEQKLKQIDEELNKVSPNWNRIETIAQIKHRNLLFVSSSKRNQIHLLDVVKRVNQVFIYLEQKGVKFFDSAIDSPDYIAKACEYREKQQVYFNLVETLKMKMQFAGSMNAELQEAHHELCCRAMSLRYSLGEVNGGLDALDECDEDLLIELKKKALEWKNKKPQVIHQELDVLEIQQLEEMACYPQWIKTLDQEDLEKAFEWNLHTFNQVEHIVKCPETVRKIDKALLKSNLGYVRNVFLVDKEDEVIAFREIPSNKVDGVYKRVLTCAIYDGSFEEFEPLKQKRINILKPQKQIQFEQGNYTLTVEQFLNELGQKNKREVNIGLCAHWGFVNFHPVKGVWHADTQQYVMPNMTEDDYLDHLPAARIASHEELVAQYGDKLNNRDFFFKVMSARKSTDLNALDCHAFWQLCVRMKDGNWKILNVGTYAYRFPQGLIDKLWLFCATLFRVLCLMDQNGYYTHRQRAGLAIFASPEEEQALLDRIYRLIDEQEFFQFAGRNCAYSVQTITEQCIKGMPNFFRLPLTQCKAVEPLTTILAALHKCASWIQWIVITVLHRLLLSSRSLAIRETEQGNFVKYSASRFFREYNHDIFNPAYFIEQISLAQKTGEGPFAEGELYWGHTDEKMYQVKALQDLNLEDLLNEDMLEESFLNDA